METFEAIFTRRSVRQFADQPVSDEAIEKILRAAMNAPSASNQQPWQFVVIKKREKAKAVQIKDKFQKNLVNSLKRTGKLIKLGSLDVALKELRELVEVAKIKGYSELAAEAQLSIQRVLKIQKQHEQKPKLQEWEQQTSAAKALFVEHKFDEALKILEPMIFPTAISLFFFMH